MATWDRRTSKQLARQQDAAVRAQVVDAVGPFSPWWRARLRALGRSPGSLTSVRALAALPPAGERDVCPDGDPAGAAALVLQAGEAGYALHADGPRLRSTLLRRAVRPGSYRAVVEADTRPTSFVWAGLSLRFPVASTRSDLDLMARAGARLWQVLGLTGADVVVSALPSGPTAEAQSLQLAALGAGSPLLAPGRRADKVAEALRLVPATVLALPSGSAEALIDDLDEAGAPLGTLTTLLLVGAPYDDERAAVRDALTRAGAPTRVVVLGVHAPDGHRLLWGECRESAGGAGLHTYPDLELVQAVDAESGDAESGDARGGGRAGSRELVLTQLGLRGSALLRWRTGDVVDEVSTGACPACGRTVPRVLGTQRGALVPTLAMRSGPLGVDVRAVTATLVGRRDVTDWRVVIAVSARDGSDQLLVHVVPADGSDASAVAVAVGRDVRSAAGFLVTQVVVAEDGVLPESGSRLTSRVLLGA
jgi:phenylacetate-coenzyme A ligase PaaK-like adenylate-forming protein